MIDEAAGAEEHGEERASPEKAVYTSEDYSNAALFLSRTYPAMKSERENIRKWQDGERKYTEDDALEELISITSKNDEALGVRVQVSGTSDPTGDIATLLASGYVKKRQNEITQQLFTPEMMEYTDYLDWKIGIVDTAMAERMTRLQSGLFKQLFIKRRTFAEIRNGFKRKGPGRQMGNWTIKNEKEKILQAITDEVICRAAFSINRDHVSRLMEEAKDYTNG